MTEISVPNSFDDAKELLARMAEDNVGTNLLKDHLEKNITNQEKYTQLTHLISLAESLYAIIQNKRGIESQIDDLLITLMTQVVKEITNAEIINTEVMSREFNTLIDNLNSRGRND